MSDTGVVDQENIPPTVSAFDLASKGAERFIDFELDNRPKLCQLQNTELGKKLIEESEELGACNGAVRDETDLVPASHNEEHVAVVRQILDDLLLSMPTPNSTVVDSIDCPQREDANVCNLISGLGDDTPEHGSNLLIKEKYLVPQEELENSPGISSGEITVIEQLRSVEERSEPFDSPAYSKILDKNSSDTPNSEIPDQDSWVTAVQSPEYSKPIDFLQDSPEPMPTQVDCTQQQLEEETRSDLSLEASPAHSCKTDAMSDSLSNEKELLDENINPRSCNSPRSDFENNEEKTHVPIIDTTLEPIVCCTPKRKNENEATQVDGCGADDAMVPNGELGNLMMTPKKESIIDLGMPLLAKKPLIGVASVNRRPVKTDPKPIADDQQPTTIQATNLSEAGPQVAEFTEEEFRSCAEVFKDPDSFEFLQKAGSSAALQESALSRLSLYVKFDPLVKAKTPVKEKHKVTSQTTDHHSRYSSESIKVFKSETIHEELENEKSAAVGKLIDYTPDKRDALRSTKMVSVEPVQKEQKLFTDGDMKKAMQIQDLLYRERILSKEKEILEKEHRIQKVQKRNDELQSSVQATRCMMEEVVRLLKNWQGQKEQDRVNVAGRNQKVIKERDQALEDLQNVETAFADLHRRYEKTKGILENMKTNESSLRDQLAESVNKLKKQEQMYEILRSRTEEKLESANTEIETARRVGESEIAVLGAQLKKAEMKIGSLERSLEQKNQEYLELSSIYDDLIARVGQRT